MMSPPSRSPLREAPLLEAAFEKPPFSKTLREAPLLEASFEKPPFSKPPSRSPPSRSPSRSPPSRSPLREAPLLEVPFEKPPFSKPPSRSPPSRSPPFARNEKFTPSFLKGALRRRASRLSRRGLRKALLVSVEGREASRGASDEKREGWEPFSKGASSPFEAPLRSPFEKSPFEAPFNERGSRIIPESKHVHSEALVCEASFCRCFWTRNETADLYVCHYFAGDMDGFCVISGFRVFFCCLSRFVKLRYSGWTRACLQKSYWFWALILGTHNHTDPKPQTDWENSEMEPAIQTIWMKNMVIQAFQHCTFAPCKFSQSHRPGK